MYFDTHCHLNSEQLYENRDEFIKHALDNQVEMMVVVGYDLESSKKAVEIAKEHSFIYAAVGIGPNDCLNTTTQDLQIIDEYLNEPKVVALGEIGLDYYWDENPERDIQKKVFREQMKLAEELNLPVVIHDRDAHADTLEIMKEFPKVIGTVHCFSGSLEFAKECVKLGYYIGITGVVTFKNARKICEVVEGIPLDRLLVETDCPYMAPVPNRGKRNKSDYIRYIIEKIAEIKEISSKEVNLAVNDNFYRLIHNKK